MQIAAYNPSFALKRGEGVWEIKKMLERQPGFPETFVDFFISNNPILLKAEILGDWMEKHSREFTGYMEKCLEEIGGKKVEEQPGALVVLADRLIVEKFDLDNIWNVEKEVLKGALIERGDKWGREEIDSVQYIWGKSFFYFYLAFLGKLLQKADKQVWLYEKGAHYKETIDRLRQIICTRFGIVNKEEAALIGLALYQKTRQFDEGQFRKIKSEEAWDLYFSSFQHNYYDIDLVNCYVQEDTYALIKKSVNKDAENDVSKDAPNNAGSDARRGSGNDVKAVKKGKTVPVRYDYYSDYYFYYTLADIMG